MALSGGCCLNYSVSQVSEIVDEDVELTRRAFALDTDAVRSQCDVALNCFFAPRFVLGETVSLEAQAKACSLTSRHGFYVLDVEVEEVGAEGDGGEA